MKTVPISLLAALCLTTLTSAPAHATPAPAAETQSQTSKVTLRIEGMVTDNCPVLVEAAVSRIDGVSRVDASLKERRAWVEYDPKKTSPSAIVQVIHDQTGFDARVER